MSNRTMVLSGGPLRVKNGITAAGTTKATATALTAHWNRVTSVPSGAGVTLPPAFTGQEIRVVRADATNTNRLAIYVNDGDSFGDSVHDFMLLTGDQPTTTAIFFCILSGTWETDISFGDIGILASIALAGAGAVSCDSVHKGFADTCSPAGHGAVIASAVLVQHVATASTLAGHGAVACTAS